MAARMAGAAGALGALAGVALGWRPPAGGPGTHAPARRPLRCDGSAGAREGGGQARRPWRILLVRHGESDANVCDSVYNRVQDAHIHLTRRGWDQAEACGRLLRGMGLGEARVFFSPYVRAQETLAGMCLGYGGALDPRRGGGAEDARLVEHDFNGGNFMDRGDWIERRRRASANPFFYAWPGGESMAIVEARARDFCRDLLFTGMADTGGADTVILLSHSITLLNVLKVLLGGSCDDVCQSQGPENCEIVALEWEGDTGADRQVGAFPLRYRIAMRVDPNIDGSPRRHVFPGSCSVADQWAMLKGGPFGHLQLPLAELEASALSTNARRNACEATM